MITGEAIEKAEKQLNLAGQIGGMVAVYAKAEVQPEVMSEFITHHRDKVRARVPDMDPRLEPTWNTIMAHCFLVGVLCGKEES